MQAGLGRYRDRVGVLLISGAGSAAVPDALRRDPQVRAAKAEVVQRHGSRRGMPGASRDAQGEERTTQRRQATPPVHQMTLDF